MDFVDLLGTGGNIVRVRRWNRVKFILTLFFLKWSCIEAGLVGYLVNSMLDCLFFALIRR